MRFLESAQRLSGEGWVQPGWFPSPLKGELEADSLLLYTLAQSCEQSAEKVHLEEQKKSGLIKYGQLLLSGSHEP